MWLMLEPHLNDSYIHESECGGWTSKEGYGASRVTMDVSRVTMDDLRLG